MNNIELVSAIASELRKALAIFNVDSLRDDTFIELISKLPQGAVMLFEDVDALFKTRHTEGGHRARISTSSSGMTFSTLLNALDGILHPNGTLIFMTTNHIDMLDSALHRPGRVDRLIHVGLSSVDQRIALWNSMFPKVEPPPILTKKNLQISPASLSAILFELRDETSTESIHRKTTDAIIQATSDHSNMNDEQRMDVLKRKSLVKKKRIHSSK
jgi:SpoVK/Ycf46/Vps4 family AAA+-type ATPase